MSEKMTAETVLRGLPEEVKGDRYVQQKTAALLETIEKGGGPADVMDDLTMLLGEIVKVASVYGAALAR